MSSFDLRAAWWLWVSLFAGGCASTGGMGQTEVPVRAAESPRFTLGVPAGVELAGGRFTLVETACTEGELTVDLREASLSVGADDEGLTLTFDQGLKVGDEACRRTVVLRARPTETEGVRQIIEESRVALPADERCVGRMPQARTGEVLRRGERLQLLIRHSAQYCGGLEARFEFVPTSERPSDEALIRAFFAHFARRDHRASSALFATDGVLVNAFETEDGTIGERHQGRGRVAAVLRGLFAQPSWLAVRLLGLSRLEDGRARVQFEYMDDRREAPLRAEAWVTAAAGELLEVRIAPVEPTPTVELPTIGVDQEAAAAQGELP